MPETISQSILIVDDEPAVVKSLERLLRPLEIDIYTASAGDEALAVLADKKISLIISDHRMPGMTGVELLDQARRASPETIRILLTGYADIDTTIEAINSGAVRYYISKPWDDEIFLSRIRESLEMFKMVAENSRLSELSSKQNEQLQEFNRTLEKRVDDQTAQIQRQHQELKRSFLETIKAFSTIIDLRFSDVGSHSQRVASLTKEFLKYLDVEGKEYQDVVVAAFLHDIGKISLPDAVYLKDPSEHSHSDMQVLQKHSVIGQSCVVAINGFEEIGEIIRHHHEDFDGNGYPDGLGDIRIPLGSKVIRIADAFDHQAFIDGYPDMKRLNDATAYLVQHSETKFDPEMVKRFIEHDVGKLFFHRESSDVSVFKPDRLQRGMIVAADVHTRNGLFVVPKGAKLSSGIINRVVKMNKADPIDSGISIYKHSITQEGLYVQSQTSTGR